MMMVAEAIETCRRILIYGKAYIICELLLVGYVKYTLVRILYLE